MFLIGRDEVHRHEDHFSSRGMRLHRCELRLAKERKSPGDRGNAKCRRDLVSVVYRGSLRESVKKNVESTESGMSRTRVKFSTRDQIEWNMCEEKSPGEVVFWYDCPLR